MERTFSDTASRSRINVGHRDRSPLRIILVSCMTLAILSTSPLAWATDSKNPSSHKLINHERVQDMKERVAELRERMKHHHHHGNPGQVSLESIQTKVTSLETSINALLSADATLLTNLQTAQTQIAALQAKITALENRPVGGGGIPDLEKYVSINPNPINGVNGPHIVFKGVNVHIQSGSGTTIDTTGLGNLIVGYNELAQGGAGINRTGSHNLVTGQMNSFSSSGGVVFGINNKVSGRFAAVLGGEQNSAVGWYSTVYGGQFNQSLTNYSFAPDQSGQGGGCPGC